MKDNWVYQPAVLKLPSVAVRFELPLSQQLISHSFLKRLLSSQQLLDSSQRQRLQSYFQGYLQISVLLFTYTTPFRRASSHPAVQGDCGSRAGNIQKTLGKTFLFVFSPDVKAIVWEENECKGEKDGESLEMHQIGFK